jgi:hypothetical protein
LVLSLNWISEAKHTTLKLKGTEWEAFKQKRERFLKTAKRSFGNTAFLMSGGATLGLYHIGIIKGLAFSGFGFPKVICGTSAGSVLTAFMGVRTDDEIRKCFESSGNTDGLDDWWEQFGPNGPFHGSWLWKLRQVFISDFFFFSLLFFSSCLSCTTRKPPLHKYIYISLSIYNPRTNQNPSNPFNLCQIS